MNAGRNFGTELENLTQTAAKLENRRGTCTTRKEMDNLLLEIKRTKINVFCELVRETLPKDKAVLREVKSYFRECFESIRNPFYYGEIFLRGEGLMEEDYLQELDVRVKKYQEDLYNLANSLQEEGE
jgi:hypothetical protein